MPLLPQGGALQTKGTTQQNKIDVPAPSIGADFSTLLHDEDTCDVAIHLLNETENAEPGAAPMEEGGENGRTRTVCKAHKLVLKVCVGLVCLIAVSSAEASIALTGRMHWFAVQTALFIAPKFNFGEIA